MSLIQVIFYIPSILARTIPRRTPKTDCTIENTRTCFFFQAKSFLAAATWRSATSGCRTRQPKTSSPIRKERDGSEPEMWERSLKTVTILSPKRFERIGFWSPKLFFNNLKVVNYQRFRTTKTFLKQNKFTFDDYIS